jgi:heme-degrading monooxygenase HmoA
MIAVIFEVTPNIDRKQEYLDIAAELRVHLQSIEGFISIERFQSLADPNKILSLSFWKDEDAISQWRNLEEHREAQSKGRSELFMDYRIRVASVIRDYSFTNRNQVPNDSKVMHDKDPG